MAEKIIALLPMKGHSERVPNKNMRSFNGEPLYHHIVKTLLSISLIEKIIVNTDGQELKNDIENHFPEIQINNRPLEICGDLVPMNDIISYDLEKSGCTHYIQTHSTNPLVKASTIKRGIEKYFSILDKYDSLFSVTKLQTRLYWENAEPLNHNPKELLRTQDLPPVYEENSNFYIFSKESFKTVGSKRIGRKPFMFEVPAIEAVDIDEEYDFILAEALQKIIQ
ncbi:MAG: acylneuraminate cytidylyltransferase family protein [Spirochaetia bacterium]|nr:acylneuraminate cytidylyltransferase family protein [Spirochaetia bacterium]